MILYIFKNLYIVLSLSLNLQCNRASGQENIKKRSPKITHRPHIIIHCKNASFFKTSHFKDSSNQEEGAFGVGEDVDVLASVLSFVRFEADEVEGSMVSGTSPMSSTVSGRYSSASLLKICRIWKHNLKLTNIFTSVIKCTSEMRLNYLEVIQHFDSSIQIAIVGQVHTNDRLIRQIRECF